MSRSSIVRNTKRALLAAATRRRAARPARREPVGQGAEDAAVDGRRHAHMSGMPGMSETGGGVSGFAMRMIGGDAAQNHYGAAQTPGMPGRYLDVALLNQIESRAPKPKT